MVRTKNFSLDIIINNVELNDVGNKEGSDDDKLLVEINFDDVSFDVASSRNNINNFREGRSIDFTTTLPGLIDKLSNNAMNIKIYDGTKDNAHLMGEVSCPWPKTLIDQAKNENFASIPFYKDCEIKLNEDVIGGLTLATLIHQRCNEPDPKVQQPALQIDKNGTLAIFNEIKKDINEGDVFFVVGSNQNSAWKPIKNEFREQPDFNKFPIRLNTDRFRKFRGTVIPDCHIIDESKESSPTSLLRKTVNRCSKISLCQICKCEHIDKCHRVFGDNPDGRQESELSLDDGSDRKPEKNQCRKRSSKCPIKCKKPSRCRQSFHFSSDSDEVDHMSQGETLEAIFLAAEKANQKKKKDRSKTFPSLPTRHCPMCCEDITHEQVGIPCQKCGHKPSSYEIKRYNAEEIAEDWGENEREFIKNHGFSKYDHCTCDKGTGLLCIFCQIANLRENKPVVGFIHHVRKETRQAQNRVEDVCTEVLDRTKAPIERDEHGNRLKSHFELMPNVILEILDKACPGRRKDIRVNTNEKTGRRLQGGSEGQRIGLNNQSKLAAGKENKNIFNNARQNSLGDADDAQSNRTNLRTSKKPVKMVDCLYPEKKKKKPHTYITKDMKKLINMNFDEAEEEKEEMQRKGTKSECYFQNILDPKLKKAIDNLCKYQPDQEWKKKEMRPLTKAEYIRKMKRKYGRRYWCAKQIKYVNASERHRHCVQTYQGVPRNMGWLWNLETSQASKGWRPGRLKRSIRELMQYFLGEFPVDNLPTRKELQAMRKPSPKEPPEDLTQKPTLHVKKQDGQYLITMNPLKDAKSLQTSANPYADVKPIQFKITRSPAEMRRKQIKRYLKDIGFLKCSCGQPVSACTCRSYMEKERLNKTVDSLGLMLQTQNLRNIVTLSDTTDSDSHLDLEFIPPAGIVKPHLRGKRTSPQATQYDENDFMLRRVKTNEMVLKEQSMKKVRRPCPGAISSEACRPKIEEKTFKKKSGPAATSRPKSGIDMEQSEPNVVEHHRSLEFDDTKGSKLKFPKIPSTAIPSLQYAKNKSQNDSKISSGKQTVINPKERVRGGADVPPEGSHLPALPGHRYIHRSKSSKVRSESVERQPRVTKPMSRWVRMKRKQPVRPPWDDSIYVPPPLKNSTPPQSQACRDRNQSPTSRVASPQRNATSKTNKNLLNQQKARSKISQDKACDTGDLAHYAKVEKPTTKSAYHRNCIKRVKPLIEPNNRAIWVH